MMVVHSSQRGDATENLELQRLDDTMPSEPWRKTFPLAKPPALSRNQMSDGSSPMTTAGTPATSSLRASGAASATDHRARRPPTPSSSPQSHGLPSRTPAEHRAVRFLSFNQDALSLLQAMEERLEIKHTPSRYSTSDPRGPARRRPPTRPTVRSPQHRKSLDEFALTLFPVCHKFRVTV